MEGVLIICLQFLIAGEWQQNLHKVPKRFLGLNSHLLFLYSLIFETGDSDLGAEQIAQPSGNMKSTCSFFTSRCNLMSLLIVKIVMKINFLRVTYISFKKKRQDNMVLHLESYLRYKPSLKAVTENLHRVILGHFF